MGDQKSIVGRLTAGLKEPPYFLAAGLSVNGRDMVRTSVQFLLAAFHLVLWVFVIGNEHHFLEDDGSKYKEVADAAGAVSYANVNQLQSMAFTASTIAFGLVLGALVFHMILKGWDQRGYSDAAEGGELLPSGVTGLINGLLGGSILANTPLFIYVLVDVDRMLYYNKNGAAAAPYPGYEYTHADKEEVGRIVGFKILLLAILKANQTYQEAQAVEKAEVSDEKPAKQERIPLTYPLNTPA